METKHPFAPNQAEYILINHMGITEKLHTCSGDRRYAQLLKQEADGKEMALIPVECVGAGNN